MIKKKQAQDNVFEDYAITVSIPASAPLTGAQRKAIKKAVVSRGVVSLQQHCAVAEATNEALGATYDDNREKLVDREAVEFGDLGQFILGKGSRARFGLDPRGKIFLTVGLAESDEADAQRYTVTWKGDAIPRELAQVAVAHDKGDGWDAVDVDLDFGAAKVVRRVGKVPQAKRGEDRISPPTDHRRKPRTCRRIAAADIEKIYA